MAHPTIDIIDEPDSCPSAAYNCVKFGFQCNDFQTVAATFASFVIDCTGLSVGSIAPGGTIKISGNTFTTGTTNDFETFDTSAVLTPAILGANLLAAMNFNSDIFTKFNIVTNLDGDILTATARDSGVVENFIFDTTAFVGTGVTMVNTQGVDAVYRDNYRLIVEIWDFLTLKLISKESYIPDEDGLFSINIGAKIAPLLKSSFVHAMSSGTVQYDPNIAKEFFIRYGESYSDSLSVCGTSPKNFESSESFWVVNSAFQRADEVDKLFQLCDAQFMTNTPEYTEMCENSIGYLWIYLRNVAIFPAPPNIVYKPFYEIFYSDGTSSIHVGTDIFNFPQFNNRIAVIQSGWNVIGTFATVGKTAIYYRVRVVVRDTSVSIPTGDTYYGSKYFTLIACCDNQLEFYFLNEFGGFDTITMAQLSSIELEQESSIFESFLDCEDAVIDTTGLGAKGKSVVNQTANDVFEVTGKFVDSYQSRLWLREFITSPERYVRKTIGSENEIFSKIIVLDGSAQYYSKDDNTIVLKFKYIINESLNLQKN